jgi:hypothetical protein
MCIRIQALLYIIVLNLKLVYCSPSSNVCLNLFILSSNMSNEVLNIFPFNTILFVVVDTKIVIHCLATREIFRTLESLRSAGVLTYISLVENEAYHKHIFEMILHSLHKLILFAMKQFTNKTIGEYLICGSFRLIHHASAIFS